MQIIFLIFQIVSLIVQIPKFIENIKTILDMIKLLKPEEQKEARAELAGILQRHNVKYRTKQQQVAAEKDMHKSLADFKRRLAYKIDGR